MRRPRNLLVPVLLAALATSSTLHAERRSYEVGGDPKNVNITFESETDFETILGSAREASGRIAADLEAGSADIEIAVPVAALRTGIDLRDKHLRSGQWLDAGAHPEIRFHSTGARRVDDRTWMVDGELTLHGVTRPIQVRADVRPIPEAAARDAGLGKGDWLRAVVPFDVRLSEFGVEIPKKVAGRVNDVWSVRLNLFAQAKG